MDSEDRGVKGLKYQWIALDDKRYRGIPLSVWLLLGICAKFGPAHRPLYPKTACFARGLV